MSRRPPGILTPRVLRWAEQRGPLPDCLGLHSTTRIECHGHPPCRWAAGCAAWKARCDALRIRPEDDRRVMTDELLVGLLHGLLTSDPKRMLQDAPKHRVLWGVFHDAFSEELPFGTILASNRDVAVPDEPFVGSVSKVTLEPATLPARWTISRKGWRENDGPRRDRKHGDLPLVWFWPRPLTTLEPTIQWAEDVERVRERCPEVDGWCRYWGDPIRRDMKQRSTRLRAVAVRVQPDRVAAFGRLIGQGFRQGLLG